MALVADIWVDIPELEGGPDRASMDQLGLSIPLDLVPPQAWRAGAQQAIRSWWHEVPNQAWAGVTFERTTRSDTVAVEIIVFKGDKVTAESRISPRQVDDGVIAAVRGRGR